MNQEKKEVYLFGLDQLALIICCKSGVVYYNQAGGNSCLQPFQEGIFTIFLGAYEIEKELSSYTMNLTKISEKDADHIDAILKKYCSTCFLSVDREMVGNSMEAWIYVKITYAQVGLQDSIENNDIYPIYEFSGFNETRGVLTWGNSD